LTAFESLKFFTPEILLTIFIVITALTDLFLKGDSGRKRGIIMDTAMVGVVLSIVAMIMMKDTSPKLIFFGMTAMDGFAVFFKFLLAGAVLLVGIVSYKSNEISSSEAGEFYTFLLALLLGMNLLASAANLLMIYLALEFVSIVSYILTGSKRQDKASSEAALKYVIYGAFASAIMLFGMSYLYGLFGSLDLVTLQTAIPERLAATSGQGLLVLRATLGLSIVLIFAGFGYKIAAVPFHMWCPDVYQGAPTPVTALLSVAPKAAGFAVLLRFLFGTFTSPHVSFEITTANVPWPWIIGLVSAITMTVGNLTAIQQTNIKRLLAYSSIAHAGYLLMGVVTMSREGLFSVLFYLVVYLFMNLGAFFVVLAVREKTGSEEIEDYNGLGKREPFTAVLLAIFLFSLAGLPPLAGFIGKFFLFVAVIKMASYWYYVLAVVGIINSVIGLYYYARIIKAMFFADAKDASPVGILAYHKVLMFILVVPTLVFGLFWGPLAKGVNNSLTIEGSVDAVEMSGTSEEIPLAQK
jgi:NADH-quinone oxidoreductase subunit N